MQYYAPEGGTWQDQRVRVEMRLDMYRRPTAVDPCLRYGWYPRMDERPLKEKR